MADFSDQLLFYGRAIWEAENEDRNSFENGIKLLYVSEFGKEKLTKVLNYEAKY